MPTPRGAHAAVFALCALVAPALGVAQSAPAAPPLPPPPGAEPVRTDSPSDSLAPDYSPGLLPRLSRGPWYPRTSGGWLLDDPVRNGLRAHTRAGQDAAHLASTILVWTIIATPFVNAGVQVLTLGGDLRALNDLELVNLEAFGLSMALAWASHIVTGRERPIARADALAEHCGLRENAGSEACRSDRNASFLSGHAASAYGAAGLFCAQLAYIAEPDVGLHSVLCGVAMAGATTTALLRVVADRHYATDVLAGTLLGLVAGVAVPVFLHFAPQAPLPVGRTLRTAGLAHDPLPIFAAGFVGMVLGVSVPLVTTLFRGDATSTASRVDWGLVPEVYAGGAGLALTLVPR